MLKRLLPMLVACMVGGSCLSSQQRDTTLPLLTGLQFDGVAPESPTVLLFHVDFRDSDGNLSAGTLTPYINGKATGESPAQLKELFLENNLALDTPAGTLEFVLEIQIAGDSRPESGSHFDVGFRVTDGDGNESNEPTVTLEIHY